MEDVNMRKNLMKAGLAVAAAVVVMAGCGNSSANSTAAAAGNGAAATEAAAETAGAAAAVKETTGEVKLGEYKGLTLTVEKEEITGSDVETYIHGLANKYLPEVTDRVAAVGDTANLDYVGTLDGEEFEGGTAYSYDLKLGTGSFVEGFEEQVVGMMPGEEKDIDITFPKDYHNAEMAGKAVVFHVKLNHLTNMEEMAVDDALAQRVTGRSDATLEELREESREKLMLNSEVYYYMGAAAELLEQAVANSDIAVDEELLAATIQESKDQYTAQAMLYGMELKDFLSIMMNTSVEQLEQDLESAMKEELVMNAILEAEGITATDEQKAMVAKINGCEDAEQLIGNYGQEMAEKMFNIYAGTYYLIEHAEKTEKAE